MKLNFNEKEKEVFNHLREEFGIKESEKVKVFTDKETKELKRALEAGGVVITIWNNNCRNAVVDEPVYQKEIAELSDDISLKLFELYPDPLPCGFRQVFLSNIIEQYC